MLTLKTSVAVAALVGTALVSAGAGYAVSRATMTAQVAVTCPAPVAATTAPDLPHSFPNGGPPLPLNGKKF